MKQKPLIIINLAAAKARGAWAVVSGRFEAEGFEFDSFQTIRPGDATIHARAALKAGRETIAVVGGDGTLSEVAEGFFEFNERLDEIPSPINSAASLAILPGGTGDDYARGLTGHRAPLSHWIGVLMRHCREGQQNATRLVDVLYGRCNDYQKPFICLNASTMGIGGRTAARVAAQGKFVRSLSGEARFAVAALAELALWRERRVRIVVDDTQVIDAPMNLAAVANALYAGGGMMLSPQAKLDDGKLDVVTASGLNRVHVLRELARIHKGTHVTNPKVQIFQGERVRIETFSAEDAMQIEGDGNVRGVTPVEFRVMPGALRFVGGRRRTDDRSVPGRPRDPRADHSVIGRRSSVRAGRFLLHLSNLRQSTFVSLFAGKTRCDKGTHNLQRQFNSRHARAQTEHVAVVVFA